MFKEEDAPRYAPGFIAVVITSIISACLALVYRYLAMWENKRRDKSGILENYEHAYDDDLTDLKVSYKILPPHHRSIVNKIRRIRNLDISCRRIVSGEAALPVPASTGQFYIADVLAFVLS